MKSACKIFDSYATDSAGVWYFIPNDGQFKKGVPCKGFGCIKYPEGSVYTGDVFYDGEAFNKLGYGKQDFTRSNIGDLIPFINEKKYKFVGKYDYRKTNWIYGNGVLYYTDVNGKPTHFCKGFFRGLEKISEYKGEFDYSKLLSGYDPSMEFDFDENIHRIETRWRDIKASFDKIGKADTVFIGDSYFELFDSPDFAGNNLFGDIFPDNFLNIGICGSRFSDWIGWINKLNDIVPPDRIVINLGFNDIHSGRGVKNTYSDFIEFLRLLRGMFPKTEFYLIAVIHSPDSVRWRGEVTEYNAKIVRTAKKNDITVGEWNDRIVASGKNCFHADEIHPNEFGYEIFARFLKELLNKND